MHQHTEFDRQFIKLRAQPQDCGGGAGGLKTL